jgi:hypothetical protein
MNFLRIILLAAILAPIQFFIPWWFILILPCFLFGFFVPKEKWLSAFLLGFLAVGINWLCYSLYLNYYNEAMLASRISLLIYKQNNIALLITATVLMGAFIGGLSSFCGWRLRKEM